MLWLLAREPASNALAKVYDSFNGKIVIHLENLFPCPDLLLQLVAIYALLIYCYSLLLFMLSIQILQYHHIEKKINLMHHLIDSILCGMFYENKGKFYIKRVLRFIRHYQEFCGLRFRLSFFGIKIFKNCQYMIYYSFQMHSYPPVCHEFQENTKSTNLSGWNAFYHMAEIATQCSPRVFGN